MSLRQVMRIEARNRRSFALWTRGLQRLEAFWHRKARYGLRAVYPKECGCSSGVEHDLAKVGVEGSNPFARSNWTVSSDVV